MPRISPSDDAADEDQRDRRPQRPAVLGDRDGHGVGADGGEAGLAEVEQAGVAEVDVEPDGDQGVADGVDGDRGVDGVGEDQVPLHQPTRSFRPSRPCGRTSKTTMRVIRAPVVLSSTAPGKIQVHSSTVRPMSSDADQGAVRVAQPADGDRREHQQQQGEAHVPAHLLVEAEQHAAETGQRAAGDPHRAGSPGSVLMPVADASSGLSDTARIALPWRLRWRNSATPSSTITQIDHRDQVALGQRDGPDVDRRLHGVLPVGPGAPAERVEDRGSGRRGRRRSTRSSSTSG